MGIFEEIALVPGGVDKDAGTALIIVLSIESEGKLPAVQSVGMSLR